MADEEKIVVWFEPENFSSGYIRHPSKPFLYPRFLKVHPQRLP
jgi:hypothetical protein